MTDLRQRWPRRLVPDLAVRDRLLAAYADPGRGYHDLRHLVEVLDRLDELLGPPEGAAVDRDTVLLAAWFHDAVYNGAADDEERSAAWAHQALTTAGVPTAVTDEVGRLVLLTREHDPDPGDVAGEVLCDADLAILSADRSRYDEYARDVRREYAHLDDATFRAGRGEVLRTLLARPRLFRTATGHRRWEATARANLAREIASLGPRDTP